MKKFFLLLFLQCLYLNHSFSQDWQCMHDSTTTYYENANKVTIAVRIDSSQVRDGYKYYYGNHVFRSVYYDATDYDVLYCADHEGASYIGNAMSAGEGENSFFNLNGDAIRFRTNLQAGIPWICCSLSDSTRLMAMVTDLRFESVLGVMDSVKYISLQAVSNSGDSISNALNGTAIQLSKTFGILTMYDFYNFPNTSGYFRLSGYHSPAYDLGENNLTNLQIYTWAPGDEFHTIRSGEDYHGSFVATTRRITWVIDSTWNATHDSITYLLQYFEDEWYGVGENEHNYNKRISIAKYPVKDWSCNSPDLLPTEPILCFQDDTTLKSATFYSQFRDKNGLYGNRLIKERGDTYNANSSCTDTLVGRTISYWGGNSSTSYYIDGLGGPYWNSVYSDMNYWLKTWYSLVYYKKGSETWGTPYDTTSWHHPNSIANVFGENEKVLIYPNPAYETVTIEIPGYSGRNYRLKVSTLMGEIIDDKLLYSDNSTFSISKYSRGMYILKLFDEGRLIGQQKLIKQ
jgi:hypothetical protein